MLAISSSHVLLLIFLMGVIFLPIVILIYLVIKLFKDLSVIKQQNQILIKQINDLDIKITSESNDVQ